MDKLHTAILNNNILEVKYLLQQGINIYSIFSDLEATLHTVIQFTDVMKVLIENGANINAVNSDGDTPLHVSVCCGNLETVCMLLYYNADPSIFNEEHFTPLGIAILNKSTNIQAVLLEYADFEMENEHQAGDKIVNLALVNDSPIADEIILRVGKVDRTTIEVFKFSDDNVKLFEIIWNKLPIEEFDYESTCIDLINRLCGGATSKNFGKYLDIIMENSDDYIIESLAQILSHIPMGALLLTKCAVNKCLKQLTKFICMLLKFNFHINCVMLFTIYERFGYCELFKILLHFNPTVVRINSIATSWIIPAQICYIHNNIMNLCNQMNIIQLQFRLNYHWLIRAMEFWANPFLNKLLLKMQHQFFPFKSNIYNRIPKFPSLIQLARDKSREYIINRFQMTKLSQFYTYLNYLDIPKDCKEIISFERKVYIIDI